MILSHKHRFVFIKGLKVAGTSVEIALSQICGPNDIVTPITPADERYRLGTFGEPRNYSANLEAERAYIEAIRHADPTELAGIRPPRGAFTNHMPLSEVLALIPEAADYQLLFTERSPYEKVLSRSVWREHRWNYEAGESLPDTVHDPAGLVQQAIRDGTLAMVRNIDRYGDRSGVLAAGGWRFETLEESVSAFLASCGVAPVPMVHAKRGAGSSTIDFRAALRPDQISLINRLFADEFLAFGYATIEP